MSILNAISDAKWQIEQNKTWISNADQKAGVLLAFLVALLTIFFNFIDDNYLFLLICHPLFLISNFLLFIFVVKATYFAIKTIKPDIKERKKSLFFFGSITKMSENELLKEYKALSDAERLENLVNQVSVTSDIATVKNNNSSKAVQCGIYSFFPWLLNILFLCF